MANDKVYEPTIAFLNSFRRYNPHLGLCLVPYDDKVEKILTLRNDYRFTVFDDLGIMERCDRISRRFHGKTLGAYRKLAIWHGCFDEFAYIDVDTIVLSNIDFCFRHLEHTEIFTSHSNISSIRKWVWNDSIYNSVAALTKNQIAFAANTGFIVSTKLKLDIDLADSKLEAAIGIKEHMNLVCMEQPFLNFLIVTSGRSYGSLTEFLRKGMRQEIKIEMWAGDQSARTDEGKLLVNKGVPVFLLHWAGPWLSAGNEEFDEIPYSNLWKFYRNNRFY